MRPFDCYQICPNLTLRSSSMVQKPPKIVTLNVSQRPKMANKSKTKGDMSLESVLIDSCGNFTLNIHPIRIFLSLFKSVWGISSLLKRARERARRGWALTFDYRVPQTQIWYQKLCFHEQNKNK